MLACMYKTWIKYLTKQMWFLCHWMDSVRNCHRLTSLRKYHTSVQCVVTLGLGSIIMKPRNANLKYQLTRDYYIPRYVLNFGLASWNDAIIGLIVLLMFSIFQFCNPGPDSQTTVTTGIWPQGVQLTTSRDVSKKLFSFWGVIFLTFKQKFGLINLYYLHTRY